MIFKTPRLERAELQTVERILTLKDTLAYAVGTTPRRWQGVLRRNALAEAVRGSNSIEGYNMAIDDAVAVAAGEHPLDASAETLAAVQGYQAAMTYVLQLADDPHFDYSVALIRSLHFMMIQHDLTRNPGRWRPGPIFVRDDEEQRVVYEGPVAENVPALMEELVSALSPTASMREPAMVAAAMAHLNLVMIHPFSDGNGRMARCVQTLVLARSGTLAPQFSSIEEYLGAHTRDYYAILVRVGSGQWRPQRDARPWVRFNLTAHLRQATTILRRAREMQRLWDELEREIAAATIPDRVIFALSDAAMGWRVRNATYRGLAEVSDQVAGRDLTLAVEAGLLVAKGERRGRHYVAAPKLVKIRERTREPRTRDADPFA